MAVSELGWSTLVEATTYFTDERLETTVWDAIVAIGALTANDIKNKALNMAYNRIYYDPRYAVPAAGSETATQKVILIKVQCEMANYLAVHLADEDRRKGLQAQAVIKAGIVKEDYSKDDLMALPVPPFVEALLDDEGFTTEKAFGLVDIDRKEDESVDTKVDKF